MPLHDFRSIYMPYCLYKQQDGSYAILNREYKPVGFNTLDYIIYQDYPVTTKFKGLGPSTVQKLSCKGSDNTDYIYLYDDGCVPTHSSANMNAYLKRLSILAKLKKA